LFISDVSQRIDYPLREEYQGILSNTNGCSGKQKAFGMTYCSIQ
jgi:hypothetical protein